MLKELIQNVRQMLSGYATSGLAAHDRLEYTLSAKTIQVTGIREPRGSLTVQEPRVFKVAVSSIKVVFHIGST